MSVGHVSYDSSTPASTVDGGFVGRRNYASSGSTVPVEALNRAVLLATTSPRLIRSGPTIFASFFSPVTMQPASIYVVHPPMCVLNNEPNDGRIASGGTLVAVL